MSFFFFSSSIVVKISLLKWINKVYDDLNLDFYLYNAMFLSIELNSHEQMPILL
jgi:hypothetical protein